MVEETTDVIIPDSCPDAENVLFCDGLVFLRSKDLSEGCLSLSLGVSATGMIRPEGREEPEVLEAYIPISLRLENSAWKAGQQAPVEVQLNRLDCHLVNPRKVMFRASVTVHAACFEENKAEIVCACPEETVQVLQETVPLCCLSMMGETSYTVEDIIALPDEKVEEICQEVTDGANGMGHTVSFFQFMGKGFNCVDIFLHIDHDAI